LPDKREDLSIQGRLQGDQAFVCREKGLATAFPGCTGPPSPVTFADQKSGDSLGTLRLFRDAT